MLSDSRMIPRPEAIKVGLSGLHSSSNPVRKVEHPSHEQHPFRTRVNPYLGEMLAKLWLDKRFVRGKGSSLFDETGRRYLDCVAAYGALPFGFNPPEIWKSLHEVEAFGEPSFVQPSLLDAAGELAKRLLAVAPGNLRYVTFTNSGTESVEAAIKLCRAATNRSGILSTENSFHGKTLGALSATGNPDYHTGFAVPLAGFAQIPFGDVDALAGELAAHPDHYAAFIVEPIQGEGGIVEAPPGYLAAARELCSQAGVLLVFDEIQTGLGRTGSMFCCQAEGIQPDVMTVAKALGGGLLPIGAVLCNEAAYSERFATKHSSTFAGNTLSCRAGLATLELLTRRDCELVDQVRRNGRRLRQRLEDLQKQYPHMIRSIRGRGYMLGIEFGIHRTTWSDSVLGSFAEQGLFTPLFASYLLNVEGLRVAPTLNGKSVIRIEPALTFTWAECEELLVGLRRALEVFSDGNIGRIFSRLMNDGHAVAPPPSMVEQERPVEPRAGERRFAFLLHPLDADSFVDYDPSLGILSRPALEDLAKRLSGLVEPFVLNGARVVSATGESIFGEFIVVPRTAREMVELPRAQVAAEVRAAMDLAHSRGAQMVGLGAYTSIVTRGGHALAGHGVPLTTGNSFTTVACAEGIQLALARLGERLGTDTTAAVVGATGSIGRAMAFMLAGDIGRLVLIGNPEGIPAQVRCRIRKVAADVCRHLIACHVAGKRFETGTLGDRLLQLAGPLPSADAADERLLELADQLTAAGAIIISQDARATVPMANVVVTSTSAPGTILSPADLAHGAVVCDLSRPANLSREVALVRPDVLVIEGGVIAVPGLPKVGRFGLGDGNIFACMAETMLLTLAGHFEDTSLGTDLSAETLRMLRVLADRHGFRVAQLRSFGAVLNDADWNKLQAARGRRQAA
jgi:acetylornithine/succinyldiaminopimelate/putrescine aminotransferase/predicted amino acid dehydrogenase